MRHALWLTPLLLAACSSDTVVRRILRPPEVEILNPLAGEGFRQGAELEFSGTVRDTYDALAELDVTWILDGEALAATPQPDGETVVLVVDPAPLAHGEHLLELVAVDSDGEEGRDEVTWILDGALEPPVVTIETPGEGEVFVAGTEITFRGSAVDNNTEPGDLSFAWASEAAGALEGAISGEGQSVLFRSDLPIGVHRISLAVTDKDGEIGEDSVTIEILGELPPEPEPVPAEAGDLVFSELHVNPEVVEDMFGEWVELYNTADHVLDLDGYAFHDLDLDSYTLVGPILVDPGDYVVLCANLDAATNGGVPCDGYFLRTEFGGFGSMALGNDGDEVVLTRPDGVIIDLVEYNGTWFTPATATGLDPDELGADNNDDETMWCDQTSVITTGGEPGTPGQINDQCF